MLVLMLHKDDPIYVGETKISIDPSWSGKRIRLCFDAPRSVKIVRQKALDKRKAAEQS